MYFVALFIEMPVAVLQETNSVDHAFRNIPGCRTVRRSAFYRCLLAICLLSLHKPCNGSLNTASSLPSRGTLL
jgi:hypothetical protein